MAHLGGQDAQFNAKEQALQQAPEPKLESLVIAEEDLSGLPGEILRLHE